MSDKKLFELKQVHLDEIAHIIREVDERGAFLHSRDEPDFKTLDFLAEFAAEPGFSLWAGYCEGEITGAICLLPDEQPDVCWIGPMYIRPQFQGRGLGTAQFRAVIAAASANNINIVRTRTWGENVRARRVFERLGFYLERTEPDARVNGDSTVFYCLDLRRVRKRVTVQGVVQGVGFRPFVFNLAERLSVSGWVLNHSGGVDIEVEGEAILVDEFVQALESQAPPLAHVEALQSSEMEPTGSDHFEIRHSVSQAGRYQLVSPDVATCDDCLRELLNPQDRRYRYPFTNCTNCGPRFTIINDIPYDRPLTTMRAFPMCPDCQREYDNPRDRRFHAQPNACPVCGPHLTLVDGAGQSLPVGDEQDVIQQAAALLRQGQILAIKGLGGFHLACDATNAQAVQTLRQRKRRPHKPFALMMTILDEIRQHCAVSDAERDLLILPQCPIVLLPWLVDRSDIADEVAPGQSHLGVMLPYTPLHHLLLRDVGRPLVMTSGNLSEEPIAAENDEALERLGHLVDAFVLHNRDISARYDDSVWFVTSFAKLNGVSRSSLPSLPSVCAQPIRRARGYAPFPIKLPFKAGQILAAGAELKNTVCLTRDAYAFVSQHVGDLENLDTLEHGQRTATLFKHLFRITPERVAHDLHPDYMATKAALAQAKELGLPTVGVQHHHAHLAACLADNGWPVDAGPVIGVIMDGTGYGEDGHIWGGEWLVGDYVRYQRAAHLEYLPLPGGDAATKHPWRIALAYLYYLLGHVPPELDLAHTDEAVVNLLKQQIDRRLNCPLTSSMGRLFDAVSALLGVCTEASYEAQAAMELETAAARWPPDEPVDIFPVEIEQTGQERIVCLGGVFAALVKGVNVQDSVPALAARFHHTAARMIVQVCEQLSAEYNLRTVALSGGCFQNRLLLSLTVPALRQAGFQVLLHRQVPCNDGGLSLGQAVIADKASV